MQGHIIQRGEALNILNAYQNGSFDPNMQFQKFDASQPQTYVNMDTANAVFIQRQLTQILTDLLETHQPTLTSELFVTIRTTDLQDWANDIEYHQLDGFSEWRAIDTNTKEEPATNIVKTPKQIKVQTYASGFGWNIREIGQAQMTGMPLSADLARWCLKGYNTKRNTLCWEGDNSEGIIGFANNPAIPKPTLSDSLGNPVTIDANSTPDAIASAVKRAVNAPKRASGGAERADTCLIAATSYQYMDENRMTDGGETILSYVRRNSPGVTFGEWFEGDQIELAYGDGSSDTVNAILVYNRSQFEQMVPMSFTPLPLWQPSAMSFKVVCIANIGGVKAPWPKSAAIFVIPSS